jgi:hypothetical protein
VSLSEQIAALQASDPGCTVLFAIVVPLAACYQVRIGTHDGRAFSFDELQALNFSLDLSLN